MQLLSQNSELAGSGEISAASSLFRLEAAAQSCPLPGSSSGGELAQLGHSCSSAAVPSHRTGPVLRGMEVVPSVAVPCRTI